MDLFYVFLDFLNRIFSIEILDIPLSSYLITITIITIVFTIYKMLGNKGG